MAADRTFSPRAARCTADTPTTRGAHDKPPLSPVPVGCRSDNVAAIVHIEEIQPPGGQTRARLQRLVNRQPAADCPGVVGTLVQLCQAAVDELQLIGAAVTLMPAVETHAVPASSGASVRRLEDQQFGLGEGPSLDAYTARRPVLVPDLEASGPRLWPGFAPVALEAGVGSIFAFPLHIGAAIFGVLTLYLTAGRNLDRAAMQSALGFTELATQVLLGGSCTASADHLDREVHATLETHDVVYQAQGMVMVDLGVSLTEALARIRAHAYSTDQDLATVATEIVAGRIVLPCDD